MNLTNPHMAIVGITGAGKSYFVKTFLLRASYVWKTNAIIIDWAGEYKAWVKQSGGKVVALGRGDSINLLDLAGTKPLNRVKQIMNALSILTDIDHYPEQKILTQQAIEQAYANAGFDLAKEPTKEEEEKIPTLKEVVAILRDRLEEGTYEFPAELEAAIFRLNQFTREGEDFFARKSTVDLSKLTTSGLVDIDLSGLPEERFRALAGLFVLQFLKEKMRMEGWAPTKGIKAIVVLDEAWKIASDERSDAITIVREGRKYQFALIVASQNPTDINEAIFSNVGTVVILRLKFQRFLDYVQGSLNFSDYMRKEITKFGVGQAVFDMAFQSGINFSDTFIIEKIHGEEPLEEYTVELSEIAKTIENFSAKYQTEYLFEKTELLFKKFDILGKRIGIKEFASQLLSLGISKERLVAFFKTLGMEDELIAIILRNI
jgi:DNA helicase HerA-like ATPase